MAETGRAWSLENFLDALVLELDKARDTLSVKALNRRLTYAVKDLSLDLQLFPQYDSGQLRFTNAKPGEEGASRITFQLGSITDRQIRETSRDPITRDDVAIEAVDGIDDDTRRSLEKVGVKSLKDLERMEQSNIDLRQSVAKPIDYSRLANIINKARRRQNAPAVSEAVLTRRDGRHVLRIAGRNLSVGASAPGFPVALVGGHEAEVLSAGPEAIELGLDDRSMAAAATTSLRLALDPYAVLAFDLHTDEASSP